MPRKIYDAETKKAFMAAAKKARAKDKSWAEAFTAATEAGYTGTELSLKQMIYNKAHKKGQKKGARNKIALATAAAPAALHLGSVEAAVHTFIQQRINAILDNAIGMLQDMRVKA